MKRSIALLMVLGVLISATATVTDAAAVGGTESVTVSLRIEGMSETVYQNSKLEVSTAGSTPMLRDVIDSYNLMEGVQKANVVTSAGVERIEEIGTLRARSEISAQWMLRVNGQGVTGLTATPIHPGDDIVVCYGIETSFQFPGIDLDRMVAEGVVRFFDAGPNGAESPVAGAAVVWDGMTYITDEKGEIIIDSTGAGVPHTVSISRYDANGLPTVLRLPAGYTVKYGFADVPQDAWYLEDVLYMSERQLLKGTSDSEFSPNAPMNRAMFVTVLGRLGGITADQTAIVGFSDVVNDGWSAGYIAWATVNGMVSGYGDGAFGQYDPVTREQLAVILSRYAVFTGIDTNSAAPADLSAFSDAAGVSVYAEQAMKWAVGQGLITGADGQLFPQNPATRAEVATILRRFITKYDLT